MTTGWASTRLRLRSEVRRKRAGFLLLVVVVALSAGVAMAAAAGARRSSTAYERLRHWSGDPELTTGGCDCTDQQLGVALERLAAAPFVLDSVRVKFVYVELRLPNGNRTSPTAVLPLVDEEGRLGRDLPRAKMVDGRLPDPAAVFEASIGFNAADRYELAVGDELRLVPRKEGVPPVSEPVRIVGIHALPGQFPSVSGPTSSTLLLTPAFADTYSVLSRAEDDSLMVRFRPGTAPEEVGATLASLGVEFDVLESSRLTSGIERTIRIETIALVVLGIVVAAVGFVVVGQILRRQSTVTDGEWVTLLALGTTRRDVLRLGLVRGAAVGLVGAALAVVVAVSMSPLFPVGIGRIADPDIGLHVDALVLALGAVLTFGVVAVAGVVVAAAGLRWERRQHAGSPPRGAAWAFPAGRPSTLVGLYLVRRGRGAVRSSPARISFVSLLVVVTLLGGAVVTVASFGHLVERRDLAGSTWDAAFHPLSADTGQPDLEASVAAVRRVRGVETATNSGWLSQGDFYVDGQPVDAQVFTRDGPIGPAVSRGRAPHVRGEIALGPKTLAELQRGLGDEVKLSLTPDGPSIDGRVVAETVLASPGMLDLEPGTGAATVTSTFTALGRSEEETAPWIIIRYAIGANRESTFAAVQEAVGRVDNAFEAADRQGVSGLGRIRLVPILLLLVLFGLAAASVVHMLLWSIAGHRRDVAVVRAMGLTKRQSWTSVSIGASVLGVIGCSIGIPLGVVLGRQVWTRISADLYVVARPVTPLLLLAAVCVALVVLANVAAVWPALRAIRLKPAAVLRTD